jgi:hypothetical protein
MGSFELAPFNRNITDQELLDDLRLVEAKLRAVGKSLTFRSYRQFGRYAASTINDRFGSWNIALRKAGLFPGDEKNVPIDELFDNLRKVWIAKGRQPVFRDMAAPPSLYSASTYAARFGGWRSALAAFVRAMEKELVQFTETAAIEDSKMKFPRTPRDPSLALRFLVFKRDRFSCVVCGRSPAIIAGLVLEVDHKLAWSNGGETVADNLQTLCFDCNRGKGDRG